MNILFVGPYRQNDGWGETSRNYIKALRTKSGFNIACRPIYYINNTVSKLDDVILESENTFFDDYDIVIQKALPHNLYTGSCKKNIGIINVETAGWQNSRAKLSLDKLDEIYVSTNIEKKWLENSNVKTPITVVSQPIDIESVISNQKNNIGMPNLFNSMFKFYCITDPNNERSNIDTIVRAFHIAFDQLDRVSLVIKTTQNGSPSETRKLLQDHFESIKRSLNTNNHYKNELIISEHLRPEDMVGLHNSCNCFINMYSGNNFCPDTITALYLGKTPIVMNNSGLVDIINEKNGFVIRSEKTPVMLKNKPLHGEYDIFTANEYWYTPSLFGLVDAMRKAYDLFKNDRQTYNAKKSLGENILNSYTYEAIGQKLCN
jgi:glycosyltransferase involved in cell wall biosynthesis